MGAKQVKKVLLDVGVAEMNMGKVTTYYHGYVKGTLYISDGLHTFAVLYKGEEMEIRPSEEVVKESGSRYTHFDWLFYALLDGGIKSFHRFWSTPINKVEKCTTVEYYGRLRPGVEIALTRPAYEPPTLTHS